MQSSATRLGCTGLLLVPCTLVPGPKVFICYFGGQLAAFKPLFGAWQGSFPRRGLASWILTRALSFETSRGISPGLQIAPMIALA